MLRLCGIQLFFFLTNYVSCKLFVADCTCGRWFRTCIVEAPPLTTAVRNNTLLLWNLTVEVNESSHCPSVLEAATYSQH